MTQPGDGEARWGAAFFDLDKPLMEGSSAFHFARASYKAGQLSRRQIARDGKPHAPRAGGRPVELVRQGGGPGRDPLAENQLIGLRHGIGPTPARQWPQNARC